MNDTARDRLEAEAAKLYPLPDFLVGTSAHRRVEDLRAAHVRAKTVSAGRFNDAVWAVISDSTDLADRGPLESTVRDVRHDLLIAFTAAGFLVEGDDDE